jgi:predicted RNA-binding protein with PIN domain
VPTIIDGYNLLRTCGFVGARVGPGTLERARGMLLGFLAEVVAPEERSDVTVVFDSAVRLPDMPDYQVQNGIHVHFATGHRDADELIIDMLQRHSAPKSLMIVSSDHQIQKAAQRRRARYSDADLWYESTIAANRGNPRVAATAAQIQLEIQLLRKELAVSAPDHEQEHLLEEFSKSIAAILPEPVPISEPEPPAELDLTSKPASSTLRHGTLNDDLEAEALEILGGDFMGAALGAELQPHRREIAAPRRVEKSAPSLDSLASGHQRTAEERRGDEPAAKTVGPVPLVAPPLDQEPKERRDDQRVQGSLSDQTGLKSDVSEQTLARWNRQLSETDMAIFPPGYGEDVIFADSFEIDHRLKKKRPS